MAVCSRQISELEMLPSDVVDFLARGLGLMDLPLDNQPETLARLSLYFQELKKWNRKINLVARSLDDEQILENHFLDSLTLLALLPPATRNQETILDVGTGAGFPGLVLKAACPELSVTLVEPRGNRFFFLKHVARILHLQEIEILDVHLGETARVTELSGRIFSFIVSRAFTDTRHFIKLAAHYLGKDGRIVLMKGPGAVAELNGFGRNGRDEGFFLEEVRRFNLPFSKGERMLATLRESGGKRP